MAQSVLEIILKLKDQASKSLKNVDKELDKIDKNAKKASGGFEGLRSSMIGIGAVVGVVSAVGIATKKVVDETVEYGKQVDDLSRALGTSTEEASKMIQIADDLRISQETLKISLRTALREGYLPNIAGLKQMSQEYQQLASPVEKAQYALKNFGRAGLEMQKVLELAPEQLDEMAKSAEEAGLVLSEQNVQATKDYYEATDQLGDSLEGLKVQLGMQLIPALTETVTNLNKNVAAMRMVKKAYEDGTITQKEYFQTFTAFSEGQYAENNAKLIEKIRIETEKLQAAEQDEMSVKQEYISLMNQTGDAAWGAFYALEGMPQVTAEVGEAFKETNGILATAIKNMEKLSLEVLYNKAIQNMDAQAAIELGSALGILDGRTVMASQAIDALNKEFDANQDGIIQSTELTAEYIRRLQELYAALDALPAERTIRINMIINENLRKLHNDEEENVMPWQPGRQHGGHVSPYQPYLVGEAGPELFVPGTGGNIIPNNRLGSAGGRNMVINQHFYNEGSTALGLAMVDEYSGRRLDSSMGG